MTSFALHYDLPEAGRALSALLRDPDDLPQVFRLMESISGTAPWRLLRAFKRTEMGARLMRERRDIVPILADRAALRRLPEGSLGRAYLAFVESEGISAEGIRDASITSGVTHDKPDELGYLQARMRDTHDLWHAATGYKGDLVGELSLLAFYLGQNWHSGIALIVVAGLLKGFHTAGSNHVVIDGLRRGFRAEFMPPQDWESLLPLPLTEVRARLKLGDAPVYTPIRTTELRAAGAL
jgi:ubiquinone biosynthesis protein COQ4